MALRQLLRRLLMDAAAPRRTPTADGAPPRRLLDLLRMGARGRKARACAVARLRAEGAVATAPILACAHARARAAQALFLRAQFEAGAASTVACQHLRCAHDRTVSSFLLVAYGESAPMTPTPRELAGMAWILVKKTYRTAQEIEMLLSAMYKMLEAFERMHPEKQAAVIAILSILMVPLSWLSLSPFPTTPEPMCPFLGLQGFPFDECEVRDGLVAVASLSGTSMSFVVMVAGGLFISFFIDLYDVSCALFRLLMDTSIGVIPHGSDIEMLEGTSTVKELLPRLCTKEDDTVVQLE